MNRPLFGVFLFSFFGAAAAQEVASAPFDPDSGNITIRCGILIDGVADQPRTFQTIEIVDGRVKSIGFGSGEVDLDLSTYTCMPGLIDTHVADEPELAHAAQGLAHFVLHVDEADTELVVAPEQRHPFDPDDLSFHRQLLAR